MKKKNKYNAPQDAELSSFATVCTTFGDERERSENWEQIKATPKWVQFSTALREIQAIGAAAGVCEGEVLNMINRNYGLSWDTIPWGRMEEMKIFVKNNIADREKIVAPAMYQHLRDHPEEYDKSPEQIIAELCRKFIMPEYK